jgi:diaminopimelate epimerase
MKKNAKRGLPFRKYQGAGNDFVLIDQRRVAYVEATDTARIAQICDRRFGVGADGLILLEPPTAADHDFTMTYFNADGRPSSMCGNGGRCIVAFANSIGAAAADCRFRAVDGLHEARLTAPNWVELKMIDVKNVEQGNDYWLLDTGSPHFVVFVEDIDDIDVYENGREIRFSERFRAAGVNVNFVEILPSGELFVATYERGVEAETLACGTGVTAAALAYFLKTGSSQNVGIKTKGGNLGVRFRHQADGFSDVWLSGGATEVFEGKLYN